jgi:hypothetical protein
MWSWCMISVTEDGMNRVSLAEFTVLDIRQMSLGKPGPVVSSECAAAVWHRGTRLRLNSLSETGNFVDLPMSGEDQT